MLLDLSEEHKEHLAFLPQVDCAVVAEFGRIAVEFLRRGSNPKIYDGAARKLNVSSDTVQHGVEGLTYLLTESSKLMVRASRTLLYYPDLQVTYNLRHSPGRFLNWIFKTLFLFWDSQKN
uniref:COMM domain containing 2 n=1 Tax=Rousettus aegyptiacus TaxID=9407 RepID=A0A7J8HP07_ROUAE|nr:COMM domain containing 2 [Rousettus aegyptiacus]